LKRAFVLISITVLLFVSLLARVYQLQIIEEQKYKVLAKNNATKVRSNKAPRGIIYDRNGQVLATSKQAIKLIVFPNELLKSGIESETIADTLVSFLELEKEHVMEIFNDMSPKSPLPITIATDLEITDAIKVFESQHLLPGISVEKQPIRFYPYAEYTSHLIGYVGEANERELEDNKSNEEEVKKLKLGDIIGKSGLEKRFDQELRGINGERRVFVDRYGKALASGTSKQLVDAAKKGEDLNLNIDIDLQVTAYDALGDVNGAIVVIDPRNGEVLALVSKPGFDPNLFTRILPYSIYQELNRKKAFINRAINSYAPGSIWKPLTSLAALEHNAVNPREWLRVSGAVYYGGHRFGDWTSATGMMDLRTAIAWSRNTYFYQIAKRMKPEWIADVGRSLGAGSKTGIELDNESAGLVPDPAWKQDRLNEPWYPGNTLHFSIGQSFLLVSPVQAAAYTAAMAMDGRVPQLHIVNDNTKNLPKAEVNISKRSFQIVREGMIQCVNSGTAGLSHLTGPLADIQSAGKTGSAEVSGYAHSTHAWFITYAPTDNPEIALACFGEGAGHGGSVCAPMAKKIFTTYFNKVRNIEIPKLKPPKVIEGNDATASPSTAASPAQVARPIHDAEVVNFSESNTNANSIIESKPDNNSSVIAPAYTISEPVSQAKPARRKKKKRSFFDIRVRDREPENGGSFVVR
jgi:penicillin-binding protein 2